MLGRALGAKSGHAHRSGVWPLVSAAEMQALDHATIEGRGIPGEILMESAGRSLARPALILREAGPSPSGCVRVLCGAGNNGGDGFVLVRHLVAEGIPAEVVLVGDPMQLPGDAAANWRRLEACGAPHVVVDPNGTEVDWSNQLADSGVIVDALFGTGLRRDLVGGYVHLIQAMTDVRAGGVRVLSVDLPSGISADTGAVLGTAVQADLTVTISLPKIGLAIEPGRSHAGVVEVARVGIDDPEATSRSPRVELWNSLGAAAQFPVRKRAGHKGSFGHVLIVAGSAGKAGAAALSSRAAARAGAGLVTLAHPAGLESELAGLPVEVMSAPVAATETLSFSRAGEKALDELIASRDVVALGPGIGTDPETVDLVRRMAMAIDRPLVIDADGLNAFGRDLSNLRERRAPTILTPHPGEAGRLLGVEASEINRDRVGSASRLAAESGATVILKGAGSIVADPSGRVLIVPTGGPVLASGGTGDVLTGVVAALLASGLETFEAAGLAAWWHGATADDAPAAAAGFGLLASELADRLPATARRILGSADRERVADDDAVTDTDKGRPDGVLAIRFPGP